MEYQDSRKITLAAPANNLRQQDAAQAFCRYTRYDQAAYLAVMSAAATVLVIASRLNPSPKGFGTHQQLGLPPCPFLSITGLPCPGCGLTTSFAHMARFHFGAALLTQPFGVYAFFLTVLLIPLSAYLINRRLSLQMAFEARAIQFTLYLTIAFFVLGWVYKLAHM